MYTKDHVTRLIADIGEATKEAPADPVVAKEGDQPARYLGNRDVAGGPIVPAVHADLSALEIGEPYMFGLALDAFDPVSGQVFVVTRPHIQNSGQPEVFLTPRQLAAEVATARIAKLHSDRLAGILSPEQQKARD